jgi:hypothetical protein
MPTVSLRLSWLSRRMRAWRRTGVCDVSVTSLLPKHLRDLAETPVAPPPCGPWETSLRFKSPGMWSVCVFTIRYAVHAPSDACQGNPSCLVFISRPSDSKRATCIFFAMLNGCMFRHKLCIIRLLEKVEKPVSTSSNVQNRLILGEMPHFSEKCACTLERIEIWLWLGRTVSSIDV